MCRLEHNLALHTKKSSSLLDTDVTPASFWITHPNNYFFNNTAAGSERYGFWFDLQKHPTGPSADRSICPPGEPLGAFEDNTAHSNVRYGVRVFNHWVPVKGNACSWGSSSAEPQTATLLRYTGYKNGRTGAIQMTQPACPARQCIVAMLDIACQVMAGLLIAPSCVKSRKC